MDISQISQLLQTTLPKTKSTADSSSNNNAFELMLQEMLQTSENQSASSSTGLDALAGLSNATATATSGTDLTSAITAAAKTGVENKTSSGLDSLSLNPQKLAQMVELMQKSTENSAMASFGSDDSSEDGDSDGTTSGISDFGGKNDISQLLDTVLQSGETGSSNTKNSTDLNAQLQQLAASLK